MRVPACGARQFEGPPQGARDSIAPETPTRDLAENRPRPRSRVIPGRRGRRTGTRESVATGRDRGRRRSRDVSLKSPSAKKTSRGLRATSVLGAIVDARDVLVTRASFPDVAGSEARRRRRRSRWRRERSEGETRRESKEREKRDGERENGRHAVILREFSLTWVESTARVSSVSVGGSETEEVEGQRSRKVRARRREVSEKESVRERERASRAARRNSRNSERQCRTGLYLCLIVSVLCAAE